MLTPSRWADVATVTLVVGETKTAFQVHEADLFEASPFFKAAFTSDFRESSERTMTLPEDDEAIFELFVNWLYRQRYDIPSSPKDPKRYSEPIRLFVLADKYDVRSLKNLIVSQLFLAFKAGAETPELNAISYAYKHTSQNSIIRKLLIDLLTSIDDPGWFQEESTQTWLRDEPDISVDMIASFAKLTLKRKNILAGKMPEEYKEKEQESGK